MPERARGRRDQERPISGRAISERERATVSESELQGDPIEDDAIPRAQDDSSGLPADAAANGAEDEAAESADADPLAEAAAAELAADQLDGEAAAEGEPEPEEEAEETPIQVEEVSVVEDSPEATELKRLANWKIRTPSAE